MSLVLLRPPPPGYIKCKENSVTNNRNSPLVRNGLLAINSLRSLGDGVSAMVVTLPGQYGILSQVQSSASSHLSFSH